jgi:hypothetical protein
MCNQKSQGALMPFRRPPGGGAINGKKHINVNFAGSKV